MRGRKTIFPGVTQEKSQILKSQLSRKKEQKWNILQISFVMLCYLMHSIINIMFGWKICSKFNFISIFLILANFAAFLEAQIEESGEEKLLGITLDKKLSFKNHVKTLCKKLVKSFMLLRAFQST